MPSEKVFRIDICVQQSLRAAAPTVKSLSPLTSNWLIEALTVVTGDCGKALILRLKFAVEIFFRFFLNLSVRPRH